MMNQKSKFRLHTVVLFALFIPCLASGQFEPFESNRVYHFNQPESYGGLLTVEIETIIDQVDFQSYIPFRMIQDSMGACIRMDRHHWIGNQIDVYDDGTHIFRLPYQRPSFLIRSKAEFGERWVAMDFDSSTLDLI